MIEGPGHDRIVAACRGCRIGHILARAEQRRSQCRAPDPSKVDARSVPAACASLSGCLAPRAPAASAQARRPRPTARPPQPPPSIGRTATRATSSCARARCAGANLFGADLSFSDLRNSDLTGANLEKATLTRASLAGSKADGAKFQRIEGYRTLFNEISATGSSFASAELQRADFSGAKLDGANFEKAELGRVVFTGASIGGVKFTFANLARARLSGATFDKPLDLGGAFLFLARLDGLDLSAATGLQQAQIDQACGDDKTKLPEGLKVPEGWPCTPMEEDQ